jgi:hypothetical protein
MGNTITQTVVNQVIKAINEMDCTDLVMLNNEYCESINGMDSFIYSNDDNFLEDYFNTKSDLARAIFYGDYRYMDNWVTFNGYGNLESFNYMDTDKLCERVEVMAEYIVDTFQDFSQFDDIDFHL